MRFVATSVLVEAGDAGVPRVVERMAARLDAKPILPPKHGGIAPGKRDIGLFAAMALAARSEPAALAALEAGLVVKNADVRERCANALAVRAARRGEDETLATLVRHADARVGAGAVKATLRFLEDVERDGSRGSADPALVRRAITLVTHAKKDPSAAVQRAAKRHRVQLLTILSGRLDRE